jgi:hypothetical protein
MIRFAAPHALFIDLTLGNQTRSSQVVIGKG